MIRSTLATLACLALTATPAWGDAVELPGSIVTFSEDGHWNLHGESLIADTRLGDRLRADNAPRVVSGWVYDTPREIEHMLVFSAPGDEPIGAHVYPEAGPDVEGRPYALMRISAQHFGCSDYNVRGRFEVLEHEVVDGKVKREHVLWEERCRNTEAMFGEVRLGLPPAPTAPSRVRWPEGTFGDVAQEVPLTVMVTGVTGAASSSADFTVGANECTGAAQCRVWVRFTPTAPGERSGSVRLTGPGGATVATVPLEGYTHGGETSLVVAGDPGEWITGGGTYAFDARARWIPHGDPRWLTFGVAGSDSFDFDFLPDVGDLAPGTYEDSATSMAGIEVSGRHRGCNGGSGSFTVHEISWVAERLRSFAADFEFHCDGAAPALRGKLRYRAGDTTQPARWMRPGPAETPSPTPTGTATPSATATVSATATATPAAVTPTPTVTPAAHVSETVTPAATVAAAPRLARPDRVLAAARALARAVAGPRRGRTAAVRRAAARVERELKAYRTAVGADAPRAVRGALDRQSVALQSLRRALARGDHARVVRAARAVAAASRALRAAAR